MEHLKLSEAEGLSQSHTVLHLPPSYVWGPSSSSSGAGRSTWVHLLGHALSPLPDFVSDLGSPVQPAQGLPGTLILWPRSLCVKYLAQHYILHCPLLAVCAEPVLVQKEAGTKAEWLALALILTMATPGLSDTLFTRDLWALGWEVDSLLCLPLPETPHVRRQSRVWKRIPPGSPTAWPHRLVPCTGPPSEPRSAHL